MFVYIVHLMFEYTRSGQKGEKVFADGQAALILKTYRQRAAEHIFDEQCEFIQCAPDELVLALWYIETSHEYAFTLLRSLFRAESIYM